LRHCRRCASFAILSRSPSRARRPGDNRLHQKYPRCAKIASGREEEMEEQESSHRRRSPMPSSRQRFRSSCSTGPMRRTPRGSRTSMACSAGPHARCSSLARCSLQGSCGARSTQPTRAIGRGPGHKASKGCGNFQDPSTHVRSLVAADPDAPTAFAEADANDPKLPSSVSIL
jgi:hypothetical protein